MAGLKCALLVLVGLAAVNAQNCGSVLQGTIIPSTSSCNSYFVCNNGVLEAHTCPANYGYNQASQTCSPNANCVNQVSNYYYPYNYNNGGTWVYPNNVDNNGGITWVYPNNNYGGGYGYPNSINNGYPYSNSNPCYGMPDGSYVGSPYSCSQFYFCSQSQAYSSNCPNGYSFSGSQGACVYGTGCVN